MLTELYTTNLVRYLFINYKKKKREIQEPKSKKEKEKGKKKNPPRFRVYLRQTNTERKRETKPVL